MTLGYHGHVLVELHVPRFSEFSQLTRSCSPLVHFSYMYKSELPFAVRISCLSIYLLYLIFSTWWVLITLSFDLHSGSPSLGVCLPVLWSCRKTGGGSMQRRHYIFGASLRWSSGLQSTRPVQNLGGVRLRKLGLFVIGNFVGGSEACLSNNRPGNSMKTLHWVRWKFSLSRAIKEAE